MTCFFNYLLIVITNCKNVNKQTLETAFKCCYANRDERLSIQIYKSLYVSYVRVNRIY